MIQNQINKILQRKDKQIQLISYKVCELTKKKLTEITNKSWYQTYNPKVYQRTYELINSINGKVIKNKSGDYTICVFFDTGKIRAAGIFTADLTAKSLLTDLYTVLIRV